MSDEPISYYADNFGHHYWHYAPDKVLHVLLLNKEGERLSCIINIINEVELLEQLKRKGKDIFLSNQRVFDSTLQEALAEMGLANMPVNLP